MNRRDMLGSLCLVPVVGTVKNLPDNEIELKKKQLYKLVQELYDFPVDMKLEGKIRLWKLGMWDSAHPENSILPTKQVIDKLKKILNDAKRDCPELNNQFDLIWGPELDCKTV